MSPDTGAVDRSGCDESVLTLSPRGTEAVGSKLMGDKLWGEAPLGPSGAMVSMHPWMQTEMPELSS